MVPGRPTTPKPTEAELMILEVLWDAGPCTVRQVHETLRETRDSTTGYTTVLKLMQIMARKGLADRDEALRSHVYSPACTRETTQRSLVGELIEKAFAGSTSQLVLSALSAKQATPEELDQIRAILRRQE